MAFRLSCILVCALLLTPAPARAQIYAGRAANGTWVLWDKPIDVPTDIYVVPGAPSIRTTRPIAAPDDAVAFDDLVVLHATRQRLRPELVRAVIQVESAFNPRARSPKGAMGLM